VLDPQRAVVIHLPVAPCDIGDARHYKQKGHHKRDGLGEKHPVLGKKLNH
jgi:hypothetical protein